MTTLPGSTIGALLQRYPFLTRLLMDEELGGFIDEPDWTVERCVEHHLARRPDLLPSWRDAFLERLERSIQEMMDFVSDDTERVERVTIGGGRGKDGAPEPVQELTIRVGEVICIVGPTGSGKSRLLADIEWVAQGDTPTGRTVRINGQTPRREWRFSTEHKLVAQLSQNMNFVMDLTVEQFLTLHADSRRLAQHDDTAHTIRAIWDSANALAGEPFALDTPITSLSGGQSRALMIADIAMLSRSPIVLIDEIENAGIDRGRALELLLRQEKIVLMATHDPILALHGQRRVVLRNGAMQQVIVPTPRELANVDALRAMDAQLMALRDRLRRGELLEELEPARKT